MKAYIKKIIVFGKNDEKREVSFTEGVNIVTGDSKTGKSALLEIIDYCLGSSTSTIPKGEITKFAKLYCIIIILKNNAIVLARKPYFENGKRYMFFKIEKIERFEKELDISYFAANEYQDIKYVIKRIGDMFNLKVSDIRAENDDDEKQKTPTIRNTTSLIFQHQNLIASKFALFYRFDDSIKRKQVIDQFPVFCGLVDNEYYNLKLKIDNLEKTKKELEKDLGVEENKIVEKQNELINIVRDFALLTGRTYNEKEIVEEAKKILFETNTNIDNFLDVGIKNKVEELEDVLFDLKYKRDEIQIQIAKISKSIKGSGEYLSELKELKSKAEYTVDYEKKCPFCKSDIDNINERISNFNEAKIWLNNELQNTTFDNYRYLYNAKNELEKELAEIEEEIYPYKKEYEALFEKHEFIRKNDSLKYQLAYGKIKIEESLKILNGDYLSKKKEEIKTINKELEDLKEEIVLHDIEEKLAGAKKMIQDIMNKIVEDLDFEEELKPANLIFDLKTFDLYQRTKTDKIYLNAMGSGANWLACHLGLFIALLTYFCSRGEESPVPTILFLDQPSQVYFSNKTGETIEDKDRIQVENIFNVILQYAKYIEKEYKVLPQIIITEHADNLKLKNGNFDELVNNRRWKNGKKFI